MASTRDLLAYRKISRCVHLVWYFGWNIVAAAAVLTLLTVGMRLGAGPFCESTRSPQLAVPASG